PPARPRAGDASAVACPRGVCRLRGGRRSGWVGVPPVWQPGGVGGGGPVTVSENVPAAVAPAASVTVTVNVNVPVVAGAPSSSPDGRSANPGGGCPDHVYGGVPPPGMEPRGGQVPGHTLPVA